MATASEIKAFIQLLGTLAVKESNNRIAQGKGFVLPSVCISQSAIETGWGTAGIMVKANAFFGIKAGGSWTGKVYRADTWEVADGQAYNTTANFRAYDSLEESVRDYYDLIGNASRYSNALSYGTNVDSWKTPRECITAIWSGGYATDTLYVEKIMNTINARNLIEYDGMITGESTGTGADGEVVFPQITKIFTKKDLIQGTLILTDSNRSVANDTADTSAVALDWNKALTISGNATFILNGIGNFKLYQVFLKDDIAEIRGVVSNGASIPVAKGQQFGFYLKSENAELLLEDIPEDFTIEFLSNSLPGGDEIYSSALAFFVKIE